MSQRGASRRPQKHLKESNLKEFSGGHVFLITKTGPDSASPKNSFMLRCFFAAPSHSGGLRRGWGEALAWVMGSWTGGAPLRGMPAQYLINSPGLQAEGVLGRKSRF